jgi:sporulation protein YhbH
VDDPGAKVGKPTINGWYDLFSRGARDWLRHNEKVRDAVKAHLPEIVAGADVVGGGARTVRVPVRMLEHYHFRLRAADEQDGVGQGEAKPGDQLSNPSQGDGNGKGVGGNDNGGVQFTLEFKVDDIVDWLWEEMELPNLRARIGKAEEVDWQREGWDRRGARSRLDRRRSMKESIKRRSIQTAGPTFTDEDLRFRQLTRREQPAIQAVVFLLMDVSGSMSDRDRQLAKTFFFWATQGLRRQYKHLDTVFVAHTTEAWEFNEQEFFEVSGSGGTVASTGLEKVCEIINDRYSPSRYNIYLFYASDGDNYTEDRPLAQAAMHKIAAVANYSGYLEVSANSNRHLATETGALFKSFAAQGKAVGSFALTKVDDIWAAVKHFFSHESKQLSVGD